MMYVARQRVVIVGGGFGGLSAAHALPRVAVDVTLIDRHDYHLFRPLLYQVATAALAPNTIAAPIRAMAVGLCHLPPRGSHHSRRDRPQLSAGSLDQRSGDPTCRYQATTSTSSSVTP